MRHHNYFVYIISNPKRTTLYTGVTNNLEQRLVEHYMNRGQKATFAGRYHCYELLYFEWFKDINQAIKWEKTIKGWRREKKLNLIKERNPNLASLNKQVTAWPPTPDRRVHR